MQRRDFVKITGAAALVPNVGLTGDERRVLLLPTSWFRTRVPTLHGRVVVRARDFGRGHVGLVWGSVVRRDGRVQLSSMEADERVDWRFAERRFGENIELLWGFSHGTGEFAEAEFAGMFFDEVVQEHLDDARRVGLPTRYKLVALASSRRSAYTSSEHYLSRISVAFVDGEVEWSGESFERVEDLAAVLVGEGER